MVPRYTLTQYSPADLADALACEYIDDREAEALLADLTAELLKLEYSDDATDKADEAVKSTSHRRRQDLSPLDQIRSTGTYPTSQRPCRQTKHSWK